MLHRCNETTWRHVGRAVLLRAAVEISLGDDVPLLTALEVVLLHALIVLVVEALLLHEVSLPRVGMESMSILPLGHLGSVLCNSETISVLNFLRSECALHHKRFKDGRFSSNASPGGQSNLQTDDLETLTMNGLKPSKFIEVEASGYYIREQL